MRRERRVLFYFFTLSGVVFAGAGMIETNMQKQQQNTISRQPQLEPPLPASEPTVENGLTVTCAICEAVYAPSPPQLPFLQNAQGALEATFMSMCHFCFRCRRAACPQCWDGLHGVCGACVQEAKLPFRAEAAPLDGLAFPPRSQQPPTQQQQAASLFVPVRRGRFHPETQASTDAQTRSEIDTDPAAQPVIVQTVTTDTLTPESNSPAALATPAKTPLPEPEVLKDGRKKEKTPRAAKAGKRTSRLELVFTWIALLILLLLVVVIALAEYIPAVNTLIARVVHIDIHAEIAYLVHIVQQLFKK